MIWVWGLAVGFLLGAIVGVVLARRQHRQRDQRSHGGTVTDWGQSLAHVTELRREISRLRQANAQLRTDRTEALAALARIADSLKREVRRLPVQTIEQALPERSDSREPR
jgi:cell division protein FtsB